MIVIDGMTMIMLLWGKLKITFIYDQVRDVIEMLCDIKDTRRNTVFLMGNHDYRLASWLGLLVCEIIAMLFLTHSLTRVYTYMIIYSFPSNII